jgi:class 3 adenylate cyclase/predicted ATPase
LWCNPALGKQQGADGTVDEWLRSIGLAARIGAFRAHGVAPDQLHDLTEEELRELGLTIGERRQFRRALESVPPGERPPSVARAERRPITVMFVDLVGSSALGERLEPDDLLDMFRRYREFCAAAIFRYGGMIARFVGDGVMACFCYPVANDDDPERAVRAALDITGGISGLTAPSGEPLNVRIGIATGRVIVGDLVTGEEVERRSIIGSPPNLAARLQALAPSGGILISEATHDRISGAFACRELAETDLHGFTRPQRVWRVLGPVARLHPGRRLARQTPFHNRLADLAVLNARWTAAREGEAAVVLVTGEAGIGKSRLVQEFLTRHVEPGARIIRLAASRFDEDSALYPVIAFLRAAGRLSAEMPAIEQRARLSGLLSADPASRNEEVSLIAELLGLPTDEPRLAAANPAAVRARLLDTLVAQLLDAAKSAPVCLVLEDLHWLDPTTGELLERLVDAITGHRVMLLLTSRDGFSAAWTTHRATTVLRLVPLTPGDVSGMVRSLFGDRVLPPQLGSLVARRTDGVPLFVEEVTRSLLQRENLPGPGAMVEEPEITIPASLHESLMARLDRSGLAKEIAQIAAVIGRSVRHSLLAAVAGLSDEALETALAALAEADVLFPDEAEGAEAYTFSHALLRDAAYDSLVRDRRRDLHARVARALPDHEPQTVAQQPEAMALHLTEAGLAAEAAPWWLEAGRRSLARSALTEATRLLRRGVDALEREAPTAGNMALRVELSALLGPAYIGLHGPGSKEAQELYARASAICQNVPEAAAHFPIYWGWWRVAPDFATHLQRSRVFLERAHAHGDPAFMLQAHHCNWASHYHAGDFAACCDHIAAGLEIYQNGDYRHHARLYGNHDPKVCALGERAQLLWMQGRLTAALADEADSIAWAERLDHLGSRVHAMDFALLHRVYRRDYSIVFDEAGRLATFTSEFGLDDHRARALIFRGWTMAMREDAEGGLATLQEGLKRQRDINTTEDYPVYICLLAEALAAAGHPDQAAEEIEKAVRELDRLGWLVWRPEVLRTWGETVLAAEQDGSAHARQLFAEAAIIAQAQKAHMLDLRVALSEARLDLRLDMTEGTGGRLNAAMLAVERGAAAPELAEAGRLMVRLRDRQISEAKIGPVMP